MSTRKLALLAALIPLLAMIIFLFAGRAHLANRESVAWAYPSVVTAAAIAHAHKTNKAGYNELMHARELANHKTKTSVVSPNNDTLYSAISLDLTRSAQLITLPPLTQNRYQSLQVTDLRAYNIAEQVNPGKGQRTLIAMKGYKGDIPEGARLVESEADVVLVLIRTEVFGANDLANVHTLQDRITIAAADPVDTSAPGPGPLPAVNPDNMQASVLNTWVELAQWATARTPYLAAADAPLKDRIDALKPGLLNKIIFARWARSLNKDGQTLKDIAGLYGARGAITSSHWQRAAATTASHLALSHERTAYPIYNNDADGAPLMGCHHYSASFAAVPVDAFWSLTVYADDTKQFVPNDAMTYRISDKTAVRDDTGMAILNFGGDPTADNYLPLPANASKDCPKWYAILRLYEPGQAIRNGTWQVPAIKRTR